MRVTQNSFTDSLIGQLNTLTSRQYALQNQVSSGLRVQAPSDDPVAMQNVLNYQTSQAASEQYSSNISTLQDRATSIYSTLQDLQTKISDIGVISTTAGDIIKSQTDLNNYATQVSNTLEEALKLVNAKDPATGQYLFGGTNSGQPPFVATRDANNNITAVTYQGNTSTNQTEISAGATLSTDVPGANNSGSGPHGLVTDSRSGADLFNHLISLRDHLLAGDKTSINSTDVPALKNDEDNTLYQVSNNGALQSRLEAAATSASSTTTSLDQMTSKAVDADLVQTMVLLNQTQNAYQAALASGSKIMQLSLLNYLK